MFDHQIKVENVTNNIIESFNSLPIVMFLEKIMMKLMVIFHDIFSQAST